MALLAMHQTGMMLCAMHARLQPVETLAGIRRAIAASRIPVWLPLKLADGDTAVTRDWKTTSDGLAARLAERLGGAPVVLVKSCRVPRSASAAALGQDRHRRCDVRRHRRARAAFLASDRRRR